MGDLGDFILGSWEWENRLKEVRLLFVFASFDALFSFSRNMTVDDLWSGGWRGLHYKAMASITPSLCGGWRGLHYRAKASITPSLCGT